MTKQHYTTCRCNRDCNRDISADTISHDDNIIAQMDEISKDVASKSPLISEPEPVENLKSEYTQNEGFLAKIEVC